jgi:hypothetical protein
MKSKGLKRNIASLLAALAAASSMIPALAPFQQYIAWAAGLFGSTGLLHAAAADTLTIK